MYNKIIVKESEIQEGCIKGKCEGKCKELYQKTCPAYHKYINNRVKVRKTFKSYKVYLDENNRPREN